MFQISIMFPVMAVVASIAAYLEPQLFIPFADAIVPLLTIIMFAMGLTLTPDDFKRVALRPKAIGLGVLLQFTVMPLAALAIGSALALPPELLVGLVLLGSCPGGTASNVISYLAKANVALSVTMTMTSSLLAVVATPVITWLLVGQTVHVSVVSLLLSLVQIVLVPVLLGVALNTFFHRQLALLKPALPMVATTAIILVVAIIVALNRDDLALAGPAILAAVVLHNVLGLIGGYGIPHLLGYDRVTCRTIAIEVGMQNSALSAALALHYFSALAALPGAIFSVWHNLSGALLAGWWARRPTDNHTCQANVPPPPTDPDVATS